MARPAHRPESFRAGQIYDSIYGFIRLTKTEEEIINSAFFQRLRWIKQLGFASYIFDGAEHTRFAHAVGVLHCADQMVRAIGRGVPDAQLYSTKTTDANSMFHKSIRIAAMLHDIGTFPFSHSIEGSYIKYGESLRQRGELPGKQLPNNHEHLGSYLIKNTDFKGGITRILKESGLDFTSLSKFIKGDSGNLVANQILHSDIDADRLDYLVRDAHHTGIKYGHIDKDYILYHLTTAFTDGKKEILAVRENAVHAVEDFLIARFAWYSQVIRNSSSAKFDILAAHIASYLLKNNLIYHYHELLELAAKDPERFFGFNDVYFMSRIQDLYWSKRIPDPIVNEQMRMLIYRVPPKTIRLKESEHRILETGTGKNSPREEAVKKLNAKIQEIQHLITKHGKGREWIIADVPSKDVIFTKDYASLMGTRKDRSQLYTERDPVKIVSKHGKISLLVERENTLVSKLSRSINFIPNVYGNDAAYALLKARKIVE
ncbi:MAG TPA: HD domain-containing protein [Oligoflexia bacterium]|nr:HD domain-containing protein [Oligoflexia bacterium]